MCFDRAATSPARKKRTSLSLSREKRTTSGLPVIRPSSAKAPFNSFEHLERVRWRFVDNY